MIENEKLKIDNFSVIQQDTLLLPLRRQKQPLPEIIIRKPQIDLERAEEIIRQFEQREQEIIDSQRPRVVKPKPVQPVIAPVSEVDTLQLPDSLQTTIPVITTMTTPEENRFSGEARQIDYPSSITLFIICGLMLLTIIRYNFGKNLLEVIQSFFNYRHATRVFEERRDPRRQVIFLSNVLFLWITSIFVSIALPFLGVQLFWESYIISILFFSAIIGLLYILKSLIWTVLSVIFMVRKFSKIYIYNMLLYNRNIGLMIFPLVVIFPYVADEIKPYIIYGVIAIVAILYLFKLLRIFQIIHALNVSVFYFILYLCTLEILPLLLLAKGCKILWEFNLFV